MRSARALTYEPIACPIPFETTLHPFADPKASHAWEQRRCSRRPIPVRSERIPDPAPPIWPRIRRLLRDFGDVSGICPKKP